MNIALRLTLSTLVLGVVFLTPAAAAARPTLTATAQTPTVQLDPACPNCLVFYRYQRLKAENLIATLAGSVKKEDPVYAQGQQLYREAFARYNAYVEQVLTMVVEKQKGDLTQSADAATKAFRDFENYVDAKTTTKSLAAGLVVAKDLIEWGTKLVDFFAKRSKDKREALAKRYKGEFSLPTWDAALARATGT